MLITFANRLDPDLSWHYGRPDLDPIRPSDGDPGIKIIGNVDLKKKSADNKKAWKIFPEGKELIHNFFWKEKGINLKRFGHCVWMYDKFIFEYCTDLLWSLDSLPVYKFK